MPLGSGTKDHVTYFQHNPQIPNGIEISADQSVLTMLDVSLYCVMNLRATSRNLEDTRWRMEILNKVFCCWRNDLKAITRKIKVDSGTTNGSVNSNLCLTYIHWQERLRLRYIFSIVDQGSQLMLKETTVSQIAKSKLFLWLLFLF